MLIEQKIERARLSQSQQLIADYLLEKRSNIKDMTIKELADIIRYISFARA